MTGLIAVPEFDYNSTENYTLSIQVSLDGFSFSIIHYPKKQLLALGHFPVTISSEKFIARRFSEWLNSIKILQKRFSETIIYYHTSQFTFIPSEFYNFQKQGLLANLVFGKQNGYATIDSYLPHAGGNIVFSIPSSFIEITNEKFKQSNLKHPTTVLDAEMSKLEELYNSKMILYFTPKRFYLLLYANGGFKLANSFSYFSSNDIIYYILSVLKQLKIVINTTKLFLTGEITPHDDLHNELKKNFSKTFFITPQVNYDSSIFIEPLHRFIVLF